MIFVTSGFIADVIAMSNDIYQALALSDEKWSCCDCGMPQFSDSLFEKSLSDVSISPHNTIAILPNQVGCFYNAKSSCCLLLNARSIRNKVHDLQALLLMDSFDIIAITETWIDGDFQDFELPFHDYNVYHKDRCNRRGGGVLVAVYSHLLCLHRTDLEVAVEMSDLDIRPNPTTCILCSTFYRPPNADQLFLVGVSGKILYDWFIESIVTAIFYSN